MCELCNLQLYIFNIISTVIIWQQKGHMHVLVCAHVSGVWFWCVQLPKFYFLCEDSIWGVRKACAECFAQVSTVCSPAVRRAELSQLFINLIYDQSRWVC